MHSIKRTFLLALAGYLALCLAWGTGGRASAQGDSLPEGDVVQGEYTPIPLMLWKGEDGADPFEFDWYDTDPFDANEDITVWDLCDALTGVPFHDGDVLYYATFKGEQGELCYRTVDVSTMGISHVMFPQVFGEENILSIRSGDAYCHVLTDQAVYTFDAKLALLRRTPWPPALRSHMDRRADEGKTDRAEWVWYSWDVSPSGTAIVFNDMDWDPWSWDDDTEEEYLGQKTDENNSISVCALKPDAVPERILPSITRDRSYFFTEANGGPRFVGEDRIFVKNWGWEWSNYWEVWDLRGRRLYNSFVIDSYEYYDIFPHNQVEDAHGLLMHNPGSLISPSTFYFGYQTLQLERLPLLSHPPYNGEWAFCAVEGSTCIFAMPTRSFAGQTQRIDFFRYSLDTQTVEQLPLTLHGVTLLQAALAPGGRIVFGYETKREQQYAGVFQCP